MFSVLEIKHYIWYVSYYNGMVSLGMKNPLANPATLEITGERRAQVFGKVHIKNIRRAIHV